MSLHNILAFSLAFLVLAVVPGPGLAMILSRTLGSGLLAGFAVTTGLILGDFVFMGLAIVGLSAIASAMGPWFQIVKYLGAAYLIWLGYKTLAASAQTVELHEQQVGGLWREVGMGLLVTLGNPKPILFYGALLPMFLDLSAVGAADLATLAAVVVAISYPVYGCYMLLVERARRLLLSARATWRLNQAAGTMFIGSGLWVAAREF